MLRSFFFLQFEGGESLSSGNLCQRSRPSSDLNNSTLQSPAHLKVQRSISANQKQRRFSDHGGEKSNKWKDGVSLPRLAFFKHSAFTFLCSCVIPRYQRLILVNEKRILFSGADVIFVIRQFNLSSEYKTGK